MDRPVSIENRWDILYRDYPDVYEAFSNTPYNPRVLDELPEIVPLQGRLVADAGAGTGSSTLALARYARQVIGIELEPAMLRLAAGKLGGLANVALLAGDALALPLADRSVDLVTGITLAIHPPALYRGFIREGLRTAREQVVYVDIPPGWYGGELARVIDDKDEGAAVKEKIFVDEFSFDYEDVFSVQEYGTVEHIVNTYGFIFGRKAIDYLRQEQKTSILWKFRVYHRSV